MPHAQSCPHNTRVPPQTVAGTRETHTCATVQGAGHSRQVGRCGDANADCYSCGIGDEGVGCVAAATTVGARTHAVGYDVRPQQLNARAPCRAVQ